MKAKEALERLGACNPAIRSVGELEIGAAWDACTNGPWMLWLLGRVMPRKQVVKIVCAVARRGLKYVQPGEVRPQRCIEVTEAWCAGKATIKKVVSARAAAAYAAYAVAHADAYAAAAYAAYAADAAADAAAADAYAAYAAAAADAADAADADVAYAAYAAAYAAAAYAERTSQAGLIRSLVPAAELEKLVLAATESPRSL